MADVSLEEAGAEGERRRARVRSIALALREGARDLSAAVELARALLEAEAGAAVARSRRRVVRGG